MVLAAAARGCAWGCVLAHQQQTVHTQGKGPLLFAFLSDGAIQLVRLLSQEHMIYEAVDSVVKDRAFLEHVQDLQKENENVNVPTHSAPQA